MQVGSHGKLLIGSMAAFNAAMITWWAQPIIIDTLMRALSAGLARVSAVIAAELLALTLVSYLLSMNTARLSGRRACAAAAAAIIAIDTLNIFFADFYTLLGTRLLAGGFEGVLLVAANASIARSPNSERAYAFQNLSNVVFCGIFLVLLPFVTEPFGHAGLYGAHALATLLLLPFILFLPARVAVEQAETRPVNRGNAAVLLASMVIWTTAAGLPWAMLGEIGKRSGSSMQLIALAASLTGIGGIVGGLCAGYWPGSPRLAQRVGVAIMIAAAAAAIWAPNPLAFTLAVIIYVGTLFFILPMMLGMGAAEDPGGGLPAAMGSVYVLSGATSVIISGVVLDRWGFAALFWAVAIGCLASSLLLSLRQERREPGPAV